MAINSLNASSYGISGLVSGMNTQDMVEKMLSGTKNKITSTQQKRAQLEYKQELYRGVGTQLRALQSSFLSYTNPTTNLYSSSFFSKMMAKTESKVFSATATVNAKEGSSKVDYIKQLARAASLTASNRASAELSTQHRDSDGNVVTGRTNIDTIVSAKMLNSVKRGKMEFTITGEGADKKISIDTSSNVWSKMAGKSGAEAAALLNEEFAKALPDAANPGQYLDPGIRAEFSNGTMTFKTTGTGESLLVTVNSEAKDLMGFSGTSLSGAGSISGAIDTRKLLPSFQVKLDGQEAKTIYLDVNKAMNEMGSGDDYVTALANSLRDGLSKAFGSSVIQVNEDPSGKISFDVSDNSRSFVFEGTEEVMELIGLKSGQSNKMTTGMRLDQINFAEQLDGNEFQFSINDVGFTVTADTTLNSLITQINSSAAGVKLTYNQNTDKFTMESTVAGKGGVIDIKQQKGNLMTALFGVKGNTTVAGEMMLKKGSEKTLAASSNIPFKSSGGTLSFDIVTKNGQRRNISLNIEKPKDAGDYYTDKSFFISDVNTALAKNKDAAAAGIQFEVDSDGKISITADDDTQIIANANAGSVMAQLGFANGQTNGASIGSALSDVFTIGTNPGEIDPNNFTIQVGTGSVISLGGLVTGSTSMQGLIDKLNDPTGPLSGMGIQFEWDQKNARINVTNTDTMTPGTSKNVSFGGGMEKIFGATAVFDAPGGPSVTAGQDAIVSIDGNQIERSGNSFTYEGISYTFNQVYDKRQTVASTATGSSEQFYRLADSSTKFVDDKGYFRTADGKYFDANGNATASDVGAAKIDGTETYLYNERAGQVDVTRDTDQIYNGIVKFVDDYNKLIEKLHSLLIEEPEYKDYAPLTEEQKQAMTEKEIEMWEEKSKTGLLRGDSTLNKIWNDLRSTMYKKPTGSDLAIYNIGITTSSTSEYGGQLTINHSKLQEMIKSDPEGVKKMFTNEPDGVAAALNDAIDRAAKISNTSPGILISVAGSGKSDKSSSLYKQMKEIDNNLKTLNTRYDSEYSRYWKQFNAMEQMIQQMNSQSSWLSQQFA